MRRFAGNCRLAADDTRFTESARTSLSISTIHSDKRSPSSSNSDLTGNDKAYGSVPFAVNSRRFLNAASLSPIRYTGQLSPQICPPGYGAQFTMNSQSLPLDNSPRQNVHCFR